jgi:uncharacterized protein YecT (DUF1311 family)
VSIRFKILRKTKRIALRKYLPLMLVLASSPAFAQQSASLRACNRSAKSQAEMNACANQEAARADSALAHIYKQVLVKASAQPEAVEKIKAAERSWLLYRDAYLDAMYPATDKQTEYGTIYPMEANLLRAKLTKQHASDLKQMLRQYNEGK